MILAILIMFIFFSVVAGMGFVIYKKFKETDPYQADTSTSDHITTAQDFIPFDDIKDGMVNLGGHRYRLYIESTSINYQLKTDQEKEIIELSFQRFLNSLSYPITLFVQTRKIDTAKLVQGLESEIRESVEAFPQLEEYGNRYYQEMLNLTDHIGNNKQKKKYIIVSFNDAIALENLSEEEKYEYAAKEIHNRALMVADGLSGIGLKTTILNTKSVAELIYSTYHKDNHGHVKNIVNGEYLTLIVDSEKNRMAELTDDGHLDWIIYEAQARIQSELNRDNLDPFFLKQLEESLNALQDIREKHAGYYLNRDQGQYSVDRDASKSSINNKGVS